MALNISGKGNTKDTNYEWKFYYLITIQITQLSQLVSALKRNLSQF